MSVAILKLHPTFLLAAKAFGLAVVVATATAVAPILFAMLMLAALT